MGFSICRLEPEEPRLRPIEIPAVRSELQFSHARQHEVCFEVVLAPVYPQRAELSAYDFDFFGVSEIRGPDGNLIGMDTDVGQYVWDIGDCMVSGEPHVQIIILTTQETLPIPVFPQDVGPPHDGRMAQTATKEQLGVYVVRRGWLPFRFFQQTPGLIHTPGPATDFYTILASIQESDLPRQPVRAGHVIAVEHGDI